MELLVSVNFYSDNGENPLIEYLEPFNSIYQRFFSFYFFSYSQNVFLSEKFVFSQIKSNSFPAQSKKSIFDCPKLRVFFTQNDYLLLKKIWTFLGFNHKDFFLTREIVEYKKLVERQINNLNEDFVKNKFSTDLENIWLRAFNENSIVLLDFIVIRHHFLDFYTQIPKNSDFKDSIFQQLLGIDHCLLELLFLHIEFKNKYQNILYLNVEKQGNVNYEQ